MERVTLNLKGMTCGHCVSTVTRALQGVEGARIDSVAINTVTLGIDRTRTSAEAIAKVLSDVGYPVVSTAAA